MEEYCVSTWLALVPVVVAVIIMAIHWGVNETRQRGHQHQITALQGRISEVEGKLDGHVEDGKEVLITLARLDERTEWIVNSIRNGV